MAIIENPGEIREVAKQVAEKNLQDGILGVRTFGLIRSTDLYIQAYQERGIYCQIIAGDVVDSHIIAAAEGYNEVMHLEIKKRFGDSVFEDIHKRYLELRSMQIKTYYQPPSRN